MLPDLGGRHLPVKVLLAVTLEASQVLLAPAIWTRQAQLLLQSLANLGVNALPEVACPPGRVFYWNTRVGMRDLFLSIPSISPLMVPSLVCHDAHQVRIAAARLAPQRVVVKSNFSLGGMGTCFLEASEAFDPSSFEATLAFRDDEGNEVPGKKFPWAWQTEPFVVERFVGARETNVSITVDARYHAIEGTEVVGFSEQVLNRGFQYSGIRRLRHTYEMEHATNIKVAVEALGSALGIRGYSGYFNVDFGVTSEGQLFICDLNVRRSAPLNVHMILRRIRGRTDADPVAYSFLEAVDIGAADERILLDRLKSDGLLYERGRGIIPLFILPGATTRQTAWASILFVESDLAALGELENAARRSLR